MALAQLPHRQPLMEIEWRRHTATPSVKVDVTMHLAFDRRHVHSAALIFLMMGGCN
jgi:hypothetical protein